MTYLCEAYDKVKGNKNLYSCFSVSQEIMVLSWQLLFYCEIQAFVVVFSQVVKFMSEKKDR